jgi:hypothetical protein
MVKADRMIMRFVADAMSLERVTPQIARLVTIDAAKLLQIEFPHVDTRLLDSEIWSFESRKAASTSMRTRRIQPGQSKSA